LDHNNCTIVEHKQLHNNCCIPTIARTVVQQVLDPTYFHNIIEPQTVALVLLYTEISTTSTPKSMQDWPPFSSLEMLFCETWGRDKAASLPGGPVVPDGLAPSQRLQNRAHVTWARMSKFFVF
jgi:hypothetical protein